jgi:hypothetical protein
MGNNVTSRLKINIGNALISSENNLDVFTRCQLQTTYSLVLSLRIS